MKKISTILILLAIIFTFSNNIAAQEIDTTGLSTWTSFYNSNADWEMGAFNQTQQGHPDYGWGIYSMVTHSLTGDSISIIKTASGEYKKIWIEQKISVENTYNFRYANLDGTDEHRIVLNCNDYNTKNFVYFNITDNDAIDMEPEKDTWDLVFTKYYDTNINYIVTGVLTNVGIETSVLEAADSVAAAESTIEDTTAFAENIAGIGYQWKEFSMATYQWTIHDKNAYFVKKPDGSIYKLIFDDFGGSGTGNVVFRKDMDGTVTDESLSLGEGYASDVYYSLENGANPVERQAWDMAFRTEVMSSSILTNGASGVELYAYPLVDATAWRTTSIYENHEQDITMVLYPNPASSEITVLYDFGNVQDKMRIELFDIAGNKIHQHVVNSKIGLNEYRFPELQLSQGIYSVRMSAGNKVVNRKLVIAQ